MGVLNGKDNRSSGGGVLSKIRAEQDRQFQQEEERVLHRSDFQPIVNNSPIPPEIPGVRPVAGTDAPSTTPVQDWIADKASAFSNLPVVKPTLQTIGKVYNAIEDAPLIRNIGGALSQSIADSGANFFDLPSPSELFTLNSSKNAITQGAKNTLRQLALPSETDNQIVNSLSYGWNNPTEARSNLSRFAEQQTEGMGPVSKFIGENIVGGYADPLNYLLPPGSALAGKGIQGAKQFIRNTDNFVPEYTRNLIREHGDLERLQLPLGRADQRIADDVARNAPSDPIATPYTFALDEASPQTLNHLNNVQTATNDIVDMNRSLNELDSGYQKAINDQYQYLKESSKQNRGGQQGGLLRDTEGNVVQTLGNISTKPIWYQQALKDLNKKSLSNKDLYNLAKKHIDEGFQDDGGTIPPWKEQVNFDETKQAYTGVRDDLRGYMKEEGLGLTDSTLKTQEIKAINKPQPSIKPVQAEEVQTPSSVNEKPVQANTEPVNAPKMKQNWFTSLFGDKGVGIVALPSGKKNNLPVTTKDQIVKNPLKKEDSSLWQDTKDTARAAYQSQVDQLDPLKKLSPQAYEKALDSARANNIANHIVHDEFVDLQGNVIGNSLSTTFSKIGRGQTENFLDYLILRHAETRVGRGENVYAESLDMNDVTKIQERISTLEKRYPGFKELAKEWDAYNDNNLRVFGRDEGLITEEMYNTLREKNPHYTRMARQFSVKEKFAKPFEMKEKAAFSGQKAPIQDASKKGSFRKIVDPRRSAIEATGAWVNAAMRNRVMVSLVDQIKKNPEAYKGIAEIVQPPKGQKNLKELLLEEGQEGFLESLNEDFNDLFKRTKLDQDNIVRAMIKGEPVYVKVADPEAVAALMGLGAEQSNLVMDIFGSMSKLIKQGATGALAPLFAVKSLSVDTAQALIQSKNPAMHMVDLSHAVISSIFNQLPKNTPGIEGIRKLAQDYKRAGGEFSSALRGNAELNKNTRELDMNPFLSAKGIGTGAKTLISAPFKVAHRIGDIAENVNRMAAAKGELRRLGGARTADNVTKAMRESQEITTNYWRRGKQSQNIEKVIPYHNAAVQGMYRFVRQWKKHPFKTAAYVGGMVMAPKAYEYFMFSDDPDYQQLPAREKYRNIIVSKNDDGTFVKVPMPPEYNAIGAFMVDSLEYWKDNNEQGYRGAKDAIVNAYTPPLVSGVAQPFTQGGGGEAALSGGLNSTIFAPVNSVLSNRDFAGRPIESMALSDRSPENRFDERTSSVAKELGKRLDMSPKKIDYLIRSYGGDPARYLLPLTSDVGEGNERNVLMKPFIVDPKFTSNLTTDFYAAKETINQAYRDNKEVGTPLPSWYDDNLRKELTSTAKGSVLSKLDDLAEKKKEITMNKSLSDEQRTQNLRAIQQQMNDIYLTVNAKVMDKKIPIPRR